MSGENSTSFWATLPGIITAIATLITAIGGIWLIYDQVTDGSEPVIDNQGIIGGDSPEIDNQGTTSRDEPNDQVTNAVKPPTIEYFDARPDKIVSGKDSTLSWSVSGDADVTITPEIGDVPLIGSETVSPATTTTYTITATNEAGSVEDSIDVVVGEPILSTPEQISPADGAVLDTGPVTLEWTEVPGATIYGVEIQIYDGSWYGSPIYVTTTTYKTSVWTVHRWRVWAVDSMDRESEKSDWWGFSRV